jgi:UTP:GlnB (protein PII) uridylyltransferase
MPGAADPDSIDYLSLTLEPPPPHAPPLVLDAFSVDGSPERGGLLYLEVRGPDRVGFLGSLLQTLSTLALVPREMWVATRDGEARDRFLLSGTDGSLPADEKRQALEEALDSHHRRR